MSDMRRLAAATLTRCARPCQRARTRACTRWPIFHRTGSSKDARCPRASGMTVLITGGAGYIGSHMVHALIDAGERVVVLDNFTTGFDWAVAPGATLVIGDSGDQACVTALLAEHRVDAIIHFAAS